MKDIVAVREAKRVFELLERGSNLTDSLWQIDIGDEEEPGYVTYCSYCF